ncbi:type IV pili methyl-accepting chemotaxis transducer N-terminal domain-containing protein [Paraburkholderia sp. J41]|uniref:type IV pili methyl-accepting chemotaxis transducer N-terminal domain-containing protein n=1 Tax=Paraburkholderia sp. J41 TaxID=2805433 RepID=UPI002AC34C84|nr:type IV pili methyl-accepting chemotaxis transducer N-terminal domain-containing protein [Paraburkholderia sp. J41]
MDKRDTTPGVTGEIVGELINLAGRQRMLSQRIVLHALLGSRGDAAALAVARDCLAAFAASHAKLAQGDAHFPGAFSPALRELYFGARKADARIRAFVTMAAQACDALERKLAGGARRAQEADEAGEAAVANLTAEATPLLDLLQAITQAYQDEMRGVEAATARRHAGIVDELASISMRANIVALNARVAAARAGQYGREFAVITAELAHVIREMDALVQSVVGKRETSPGAANTSAAASASRASGAAPSTSPTSTSTSPSTSPSTSTSPASIGARIQRMPARVAG